MSNYTFTKLNARQISTVIAALRHWQRTIADWPSNYMDDHFKTHTALDVHEIDKLCDELGNPISVESEVDLDATQPLESKRGRRHREAYLHVQSLYGESVIGDVVEQAKQGTKVMFRSHDLKPLAYAAAALELMKTQRAKCSKLTVECMMTTIYDHTECEVTALHIPALEDAHAALRAITEQHMKINMNRREV